MQMIIRNKKDLDIAYAKGIRRLYVTRTMTLDFHYGQWEVRGAKGCTVRVNLHQKAYAEVSGNAFVYANDDSVVRVQSGANVTANSETVTVVVDSPYDSLVRNLKDCILIVFAALSSDSQYHQHKLFTF